MSASKRYSDQIRGLTQLAVTATSGVTDVVEEMHGVIASGPAILGKPLSRPVRALLPLIYNRVRGATGLVGAGLDTAAGWFAVAGSLPKAMTAKLRGDGLVALGTGHVELLGSPSVYERLRSWL